MSANRTIADTPPPEALAELDAAAAVLQDLARNGTELALVHDEQGVHVELRAGGELRRLHAHALLDLLSRSANAAETR